MPKRFQLRINPAAWIALAVACLAHAQTFDAASVKPSSGGRPDSTGGPGTKDPGRIHYSNLSLQYLLQIAYNLQPFQIAGPAWLDTERFDIEAVLPPASTQDEFHTMLQNLLTARFRMTAHREAREVSAYGLAPARNGPKLKESTEDLGPQDVSADAPKLVPGKDGFFAPPRRPGMFLQLIGMGAVREDFRQSTTQDLARVLEGQLSRPVIDETGLKGKYDFTLTYSTQGLDMGRGRMLVNAATVENPPDVGAALRSQLGLQLQPRKEPAKLLVIDHIEKRPTEN